MNVGARVRPTSRGVGVTAVALALVIGGFSAWATLNLGIAGVAFVAMFAVGYLFLNRKPIPSSAVGSGLYITAMLMILTPILFYLPTIFGSADVEGAAGAGQFFGGILGLVIWGFVFLLFAIVTAAVGYFFSRRASKKLDTRSAAQ